MNRTSDPDEINGFTETYILRCIVREYESFKTTVSNIVSKK